MAEIHSEGGIFMATRTKSTASGYGWVILAVTFLAGFTAPANMAKVTALAPVIMEQFAIGPDTLGWVIALFYVLGFVMAFPTAALINKLGIRNVVLVAIGCAIVGSVIGAATTDVTVFMISRVFEGAGMGVMGVAGASAIAPWFKAEKRGLPLGIWAMWVALAMCICPVLYGWVVEALGMPWQAVWWGTVVFDIIVGVLFVALYREPADPQQSEDEQVPHGPAVFGRAYKNPALWGLALIFLFDEAAFMAINGFLTTYLSQELQTTLVFATAIASAFGVAGAVCAPLSGWLSDLLKTRKWILLFALVGGVAYTAAVFTCQDPNLYWGIMVLAGIAGGFVPSVIWQATPDTVEPDDVPAANSLVAFTQNLGMFIGAIFMGQAITAFGWATGSYVSLVPCYVICIIIFFAVVRKHLK